LDAFLEQSERKLDVLNSKSTYAKDTVAWDTKLRNVWKRRKFKINEWSNNESI
jgi:hypothetical protein